MEKIRNLIWDSTIHEDNTTVLRNTLVIFHQIRYTKQLRPLKRRWVISQNSVFMSVFYFVPTKRTYCSWNPPGWMVWPKHSGPFSEGGTSRFSFLPASTAAKDTLRHRNGPVPQLISKRTSSTLPRVGLVQGLKTLGPSQSAGRQSPLSAWKLSHIWHPKTPNWPSSTSDPHQASEPSNCSSSTAPVVPHMQMHTTPRNFTALRAKQDHSKSDREVVKKRSKSSKNSHTEGSTSTNQPSKPSDDFRNTTVRYSNKYHKLTFIDLSFYNSICLCVSKIE